MKLISKIKKLRELTSCPIMEIKKALEATGGDMVKAVEKMRKSRPIKIAGSQKNGRISVRETDEYLLVVVLRCQTDFAANSEEVSDCLNGALEEAYDDIAAINEMEDHLRIITKEEIDIDVYKYSKSERYMGYYLHFDNRKVAIVRGSTEAQIESDLFKNIAMQVVAYPNLPLKELYETVYVKDSTLTVKDLMEANKVSTLFNDYFEV